MARPCAFKMDTLCSTIPPLRYLKVFATLIMQNYLWCNGPFTSNLSALSAARFSPSFLPTSRRACAPQVEDPQRDLVTPALEGTRNVMNSVARVGKGVRRVVVTSSLAAIRSKDPGPGGVWTEECWNDWSTLEDNPYSEHRDSGGVVYTTPQVVLFTMQCMCGF